MRPLLITLTATLAAIALFYILYALYHFTRKDE